MPASTSARASAESGWRTKSWTSCLTCWQPAALTATAQALAEVDAHYRRDLAVFELAVERARYEADRALRQFDNVEPENRLVARTLEANLDPSWPRSAPPKTIWPPNAPAARSR